MQKCIHWLFRLVFGYYADNKRGVAVTTLLPPSTLSEVTIPIAPPRGNKKHARQEKGSRMRTFSVVPQKREKTPSRRCRLYRLQGHIDQR